jgi:hypothetical protein
LQQRQSGQVWYVWGECKSNHLFSHHLSIVAFDIKVKYYGNKLQKCQRWRKKERELRFSFHEFCDVAKVVSIPKRVFALVDNTYVKNGTVKTIPVDINVMSMLKEKKNPDIWHLGFSFCFPNSQVSGICSHFVDFVLYGILWFHPPKCIIPLLYGTQIPFIF